MPRGIKYSAEQREQMKQKAQKLRQEGRSLKDITQELNIAMGTLNRLLGGKTAGKRRARRARRPAAAVEAATIKLSASNPMAQMALVHERLLEVGKQIEALTAERAKLAEKMDALMKKAAEICPGLKSGKK